MYHKLVEKVNNIDTSRFILKTRYDADESELEKKILILVSLFRKQIAITKLVKQKIKYLVLKV